MLAFWVGVLLTAQSRWMYHLHMCENPENIPSVIDSNGLRSYGKYQWQMRSWLNYGFLGATRENISDDAVQDKVTKWVLDHEGTSKWYNCSKIVTRRYGSYSN